MKEHRRLKRSLLATTVAVTLAGNTGFADDGGYDGADVTHAVEAQMYTDPGVQPNGINISTMDGIVTLTGNVDNLLAKERAGRVAETIKGVRSVVNRIGITPSGDGDRDIQDNVKRALVYDPVTESWELNVTVEDGVAFVSGKVDSWAEREVVAAVIKGVKGVTGVQNNITIDFKTTRGDGEISEEIKRRLKWDALVDDALIDVMVHEAKVTLSGTVGSAAERTRAQNNAWVNGVTAVNAEGLDVKYWDRNPRLKSLTKTAPSDRAIEQAVQDAFLYDPRVYSFQIDSPVDNGTVVLSGVVDNIKAKRAAVEDARNTIGVRYVKDHIRVRPLEQADTTIARKIRNALARDPYVERRDITVAVENGIVTLQGRVNSAYEKAQAENVAEGIKGLVQVDNHLMADATWLHYNPYVGGLSPFNYDWYEYPASTVLTDLEIEQKIQDEFFWSPFVDGDHVQVDVNHGVATLTGTVGSYSEYQSAEENAREGGAISVDNDLQIKPDSSS